MKSFCDLNRLLLKSAVAATAHRKKILNVITRADCAMTPKDILARISRKKPFDKVTLYRTLDLFVEKKILRRVANSRGTMCYEILCEEHNPSHPHFICRSCGAIECLEGIDLRSIQTQIKRKSKIFHADIDLKLEGLCMECQKN